MKNEFRKRSLNIRNSLDRINLDDKVLALEEFKRSKTVFIYVSFGSEAETFSLIEKALKEKEVLVPYCVDNNGTMIACKINSLSDLKAGSFGISEPKIPVEYKGEIDFSVIPGVAFSEDGKRIGYGKGYYDRFLSSHNTFSVGICHDELLFGSIPCNELDFRLDMIITPKREIRL